MEGLWRDHLKIFSPSQQVNWKLFKFSSTCLFCFYSDKSTLNIKTESSSLWRLQLLLDHPITNRKINLSFRTTRMVQSFLTNVLNLICILRCGLYLVNHWVVRLGNAWIPISFVLRLPGRAPRCSACYLISVLYKYNRILEMKQFMKKWKIIFP